MVAGHKRRTALAVRCTSAASRADAAEAGTSSTYLHSRCASRQLRAAPMPMKVWPRKFGPNFIAAHVTSIACHRSLRARARSPILCARARPPARRSPPWLAGLMLRPRRFPASRLSPVSPRPSVSSLGDTNMALRDNLE